MQAGLGRREILKLAAAAPLSSIVKSAPTPPQQTLPDTRAWLAPHDIAAEQYAELHDYFAAQTAEIARLRKAGSREDLKRMIGAQDPLQAPQARRAVIGANDVCTAELVTWQILQLGSVPSTSNAPAGVGVHAQGILLTPRGSGPFAAAIAIPDATESAADIAGLTGRSGAPAYAMELASAGHLVYVPFLVQRRTFSQPWADDRAWLFRIAYLSGRHIIGSDVQQILSAVDFLSSSNVINTRQITVAGCGQGGLTALIAGALDTRISETIVADYFDQQEAAYQEPEDRMLWGHLLHFGDGEIATLIAPRKLTLLCNQTAEHIARVRGEVARLAKRDHIEIRLSQSIPSAMGAAATQPASAAQIQMDPWKLAAIANQQFTEWQARFRNMAIECYRTREQWQLDTESIDGYRRSIQPRLNRYLDTLGRYPTASGPLDPQTFLVYDEPDFRGYRLKVRVYDGVHVCGILLIPKSLQPGERRPVIFTVHGFGDRPEDVVYRDKLYHGFASKLVKRGYVVFAPMISVQDGEQRNLLVRRSHVLGRTPVGLELVKFGRAIDYLSTLSFVDPARFAIYGLSYGGYTALRIGAGEPRFRAVISAGDFNETTIKNMDISEGTSFLFHWNGLDRYIFGWLNDFSDSVLACLIAPRAYMTEVGDSDPVIVEPRRFFDADIATYLNTYRKLGIADRAGVARFAGPHEINGVATFEFLDRVLEWKPS